MVTRSSSKTILLVDDIPEDLALYSRALGEAGYRAITTLIGTDYFGIHHNESPALILLDRTLVSSLSAATIAKVLRDIFPTSPIVMFSKSAQVPPDVNGLIQGVLQKRGPAKLLSAVRNLLEKESPAEAATAAN